jgi:hypothetical protein
MTEMFFPHVGDDGEVSEEASVHAWLVEKGKLRN